MMGDDDNGLAGIPWTDCRRDTGLVKGVESRHIRRVGMAKGGALLCVGVSVISFRVGNRVPDGGVYRRPQRRTHKPNACHGDALSGLKIGDVPILGGQGVYAGIRVVQRFDVRVLDKVLVIPGDKNYGGPVLRTPVEKACVQGIPRTTHVAGNHKKRGHRGEHRRKGGVQTIVNVKIACILDLNHPYWGSRFESVAKNGRFLTLCFCFF